MNPIHGEDLAQFCVQSFSLENVILDIGGPEILTYNQVVQIAFAACNSYEDIPVQNENVTIENMDKIKTGDKETGEGGTLYSDVISLFDGEPDNRYEVEGDPKKVEAEWYYDVKGYQSITVDFVDDKATKKSQTKMK